MAIWQFDVCIIPIGAPEPIRTQDGYDPAPISPGAASRAKAWCKSRWPLHQWSDDVFVFGADQGCRIDVSMQDNLSAELSARVDLREPSDDFCRSICELATLLDCTFFSPELWRFVPADGKSIRDAAKLSRGARYVEDPRSILRIG